MENDETYDYTFECDGFTVRGVGVSYMKAKVKVDEQFNILSNNAQTGFRGKLINLETGEYLIERAQWTWNMRFENNISTKSVLTGTQWQVVKPGEGILWANKGVLKYVGIYINLLTGEIEFTDPYHVAGKHPYEGLDVCEALR